MTSKLILKKIMKKNKKTNLENSSSESKEKLQQIGQKLGVNVPEDLKNFEANKLQDNEVVKHLTDTDKTVKMNVTKKVIHTNKPHVDRYNPSHTNIEHDEMTYVDNG